MALIHKVLLRSPHIHSFLFANHTVFFSSGTPRQVRATLDTPLPLLQKNMGISGKDSMSTSVGLAFRGPTPHQARSCTESRCAGK